ncbi:hypothetical protein [Bradyrhizobium sp. USDA 4454]
MTQINGWHGSSSSVSGLGKMGEISMGRCLIIVAALSLFASSANATTMEECRAQYKAEYNHPAKKKGVGIAWDDYQVKRCGIQHEPMAPKHESSKQHRNSN